MKNKLQSVLFDSTLIKNLNLDVRNKIGIIACIQWSHNSCETDRITKLGCFYVTAILNWGWVEIDIEAEVDLRLRLSWGWGWGRGWGDVELKFSWNWVELGIKWFNVELRKKLDLTLN